MKYILVAVINLLYCLAFAVVYIILCLWDFKFRENAETTKEAVTDIYKNPKEMYHVFLVILTLGWAAWFFNSIAHVK